MQLKGKTKDRKRWKEVEQHRCIIRACWHTKDVVLTAGAAARRGECALPWTPLTSSNAFLVVVPYPTLFLLLDTKETFCGGLYFQCTFIECGSFQIDFFFYITEMLKPFCVLFFFISVTIAFCKKQNWNTVVETSFMKTEKFRALKSFKFLLLGSTEKENHIPLKSLFSFQVLSPWSHPRPLSFTLCHSLWHETSAFLHGLLSIGWQPLIGRPVSIKETDQFWLACPFLIDFNSQIDVLKIAFAHHWTKRPHDRLSIAS